MTKSVWLLLICLGISPIALAERFDLSSYHNSNQLVWDNHFRQHTQTFFGNHQQQYFWKAPTHEQFLAGLGGPPHPLKSLDTHTYLASACRAHSCFEKSAYISNASQELYAMLAYQCPGDDGHTDYRQAGCLLIFYRDPDALAQLKAPLLRWQASHAKDASLHEIALGE
ncbi:hypothetical protein SAMN04488540_11497 [Ferrimonas sediminum]|uniref:Uncharacterized protein n=1 Tax=Ferrimonas sediminum TaxID=718193 RepID=A0A1G8X5U9_9GAMM|nr:hypothetical protein [Ferrimonas sediminum]SDJ86019.1 hypothetical protein SAMN04488540_11497 [Ferrimonas sediminum]